MSNLKIWSFSASKELLTANKISALINDSAADVLIKHLFYTHKRFYILGNLYVCPPPLPLSCIQHLCALLFCLLAAIGRTLIPRYFSTVFEGGVSELHYILKHSKESFHNSCITLDCDQCTMVTQHGKPMFTKVTPDPRAPLPMLNDPA